MSTAGYRRRPEHYAGDDTKVQTLAGGILAAYEGISVEDFEAQSDAFLRSARHPTLGRDYLRCAYSPMVELLSFLEANEVSSYIASGGRRDFMRPISQEMYGIPRERVIGSTAELAYISDGHGGAVIHKAEPDYPDDGPEKPVRIWSRIGRRPLLAAGNSNGTSPCCSSPSTRTNRPSACSSCTTTANASSTTRLAPSRHSSKPMPQAGRLSA